MKRFLAFTFAVYLISLPVGLCYASFTSPFVARLAPAAAAASSAGIKIPAKITGVTSGGLNVASWISLLIPGSNVAKIAIAVAAVGGGLAADYLMLKGAAWFASKGITHDDSGWYLNSTIKIPNGHVWGDYTKYFPKGTAGCASTGCFSCDATGKGIFPDYSTAYAAGRADQLTDSCAVVATGGNTGSNYILEGAYYVYWSSQCPDRPRKSFFYFYPINGAAYTEMTDVQSMSLNYLGSLLTTDLNSGNANALSLGLGSVEIAADALDNPNHPVNANATSKAAIAAALAGSINANQLANLEAAGTAAVGDGVLPDEAPNINTLTPAQIAAAVRAALEGQGLSASQIAAAIAAVQQAAAQGLTQAQAQVAVAAALAGAGLSDTAIGAATAAALAGAGLATNAGIETAVKNALDDETGIVPPTDPTPLIPDKLSLTAVLTAFVAAIQQLPIMQTLNGLTINTSGTSVLSLTFLGTSYSYDVGGMASALNTIGSALLGLTTVFSFVGIFRS